MTLGEFLKNPVGKGDASVNVSLITDSLQLKYTNKYTDNAKVKKKIEMKCFHQPVKDIFWIWLVIPTETERDNSYDVVFKFINPEPKINKGMGIGKFDIQIFANSPSFAYTYSYVYNQNGLLIPSLAKKLGSHFTKKSPDVRNRNKVVLFDKYVYFGAKYIMDSKILNRMVITAKATTYSDKLFEPRIRTLEKIMDEYDIAEKKLKKKKKGETKKQTKPKSSGEGVNVIGKKASVTTITKNAARKSTVKKNHGTIKKR